MDAWLREIGLSQYTSALMNEGHDDLDFFNYITEEVLIKLGMTKQGHIRKFLRSLPVLENLPKSK